MEDYTKKFATKAPRIMVACFCLLLFHPHLSKSQHGLYLTGGIEVAGINQGYRFQQQGTILQDQFQLLSNYDNKKFTGGGLCFNFSLGLQYQLSDRVMMEAGFNLSQIDLIVHDRSFQDQNDVYGRPPISHWSGAYADRGNFDFAKWYHALYVSTYYFFRDQQRKMRPYVHAGITYHYYSPGPKEFSGSYFHEATDENLFMTTQFTSNYLSTSMELGIKLQRPSNRTRHAGRVAIFMGMRYRHSGVIISGDYSNTQGGTLKYADQVSATGSNFAFVVKMSGLLAKEPGKGSKSKGGSGTPRSKAPKKKRDQPNSRFNEDH